MRHQFTPEERLRGGKNGFRAAVFKVQVEHGLEFNDAVQWLKRKIGWNYTTRSRYGEASNY